MVKMNSARILIVDDEKALRRVLKTTLHAGGYRIFEAADGKTALESSKTVRPDVIILDLGLPDCCGIDLAREIRGRGAAVPIIVLTVRDQETDKVAALDAGADDYLTKPFSTPELLARVRAVMRRWVPQGTDQVFRTGELTMDVSNRSVMLGENPVRLTPTEYDVLKALVLKAGKVVTRGQLFQEIWNKTEGAEKVDHLLRVTINKLRNKIEPDSAIPTYILTEPGIGYRLTVIEPKKST